MCQYTSSPVQIHIITCTNTHHHLYQYTSSPVPIHVIIYTGILVSPLSMKSREWLVWDVIDTSATCWSSVRHHSETDRQTQNDSAHRRVYVTFKSQMLTFFFIDFFNKPHHNLCHTSTEKLLWVFYFILFCMPFLSIASLMLLCLVVPFKCHNPTWHWPPQGRARWRMWRSRPEWSSCLLSLSTGKNTQTHPSPNIGAGVSGKKQTNNNLNEKYVGKCAGGEAVKVQCVRWACKPLFTGTMWWTSTSWVMRDVRMRTLCEVSKHGA